MRKVIVFIAHSLDGYIATKQDDVSWLDTVIGKGDNGYQDFYDTVDTVIMGRRTFDWIDKMGVDYPYTDKESYVVTTNEAFEHTHAKRLQGDVATTILEMKKQDGKDIWIVGGGKLIGFLLNSGVIDELQLTVAPIIFSDGLPLFSNLSKEFPLQLQEVKRYGQFAVLIYKV